MLVNNDNPTLAHCLANEVGIQCTNLLQVTHIWLMLTAAGLVDTTTTIVATEMCFRVRKDGTFYRTWQLMGRNKVTGAAFIAANRRTAEVKAA